MGVSLSEIKAIPSHHKGIDFGPAFQYRNNIWKHQHLKAVPEHDESAEEGHALGMVVTDKDKLKISRKDGSIDNSYKIFTIIYW